MSEHLKQKVVFQPSLIYTFKYQSNYHQWSPLPSRVNMPVNWFSWHEPDFDLEKSPPPNRFQITKHCYHYCLFHNHNVSCCSFNCWLLCLSKMTGFLLVHLKNLAILFIRFRMLIKTRFYQTLIFYFILRKIIIHLKFYFRLISFHFLSLIIIFFRV